MLKKNQINYLLNKSDKYSSYTDYVRCDIKNIKENQPFINYFDFKNSLLDFDNSNIACEIIDWFNITFNKVNLNNWTGLIWSLVYNETSIPVFIILEYYKHNKKKFNSWGKIDFYGQFCRLKELWIIKDYFFKKHIENMPLTRYDWKIDLFNLWLKNWYVKYEYFCDRVNKLVETNWKIWKEMDLFTKWNKSKIHSWKLWNKENKTSLLRWYDKIKDTQVKWKFALYGDYFTFKSVFRLEWEFWVKFCKWHTLKEIEKLLIKINKFLKIDIELYRGKFYFTYEKLDLSDEIQKLRYFKMFKWYLKWVIENNINPYQFVDSMMLQKWYTMQNIKYLKQHTKKPLYEIKI